VYLFVHRFRELVLREMGYAPSISTPVFSERTNKERLIDSRDLSNHDSDGNNKSENDQIIPDITKDANTQSSKIAIQTHPIVSFSCKRDTDIFYSRTFRS
jgi:hypothetical protein